MDREKLNKELNRKRCPVIVYVAIVALLFFVFAKIGFFNFSNLENVNDDPAAIIAFKICIVLLVINFALLGIVITRKYRFHDDGLTVIWLGIFPHKFSWDKISHGGVVLSCGFRSTNEPFILCSKHKWIKTVNASLFWVLFPFSVFNFPYTPEIYKEFEKVCANFEYIVHRDIVMEKYRQLNKW